MKALVCSLGVVCRCTTAITVVHQHLALHHTLQLHAAHANIASLQQQLADAEAELATVRLEAGALRRSATMAATAAGGSKGRGKPGGMYTPPSRRRAKAAAQQKVYGPRSGWMKGGAKSGASGGGAGGAGGGKV